MARTRTRDRASDDLSPEEQLRLAGYPTENAHGVDEDHADETVEDWAARIRDSHEEEIQAQVEQAGDRQVNAAEETSDGV